MTDQPVPGRGPGRNREVIPDLCLCFLALTLGASDPPESIVLSDVAADAGVSFSYQNGSRGKHDLPEIIGGGVALIDGDGDGFLDLFFCNGGPIEPGSVKIPDDSPCHYYRNLGGGRFRDLTRDAGTPGPSYAMGAAVADYDGDGRDDLFVTGWRDQRLYRNLGGGRFEDVTLRAGLESHLWSTSAAWADLDEDGDLDLYVACYLDYDPALAPYCTAPDGRRDYCGPESFSSQRDHLYRNNGDGTFTDVAEPAGIDQPAGRGLGVIVANLVGDARLDLFVANDGSACRLYENLGGLRFCEVGEASGVAFDGDGQALAGMGIALGDIDRDGRPDLCVSNYLGRSTVAFRAVGRGVYHDEAAAFGLRAATRNVLGFGLALVDLDSDGELDLVQANGHVLDRSRLGVPFAMRPTVLRNVGGRFQDVTSRAGLWTERLSLGRGLAVGDLDNDGRPDLVMSRLDAPPDILMNRSADRSVVLELVGRRCQAFGSRVRVEVGGRVFIRVLPGGGSYLSSSDRRIFLGIGDDSKLDRVEVNWPSGQIESWRDLPARPILRLQEGTGMLGVSVRTR
jgi:hypothetical protein